MRFALEKQKQYHSIFDVHSYFHTIKRMSNICRVSILLAKSKSSIKIEQPRRNNGLQSVKGIANKLSCACLRKQDLRQVE